MEIYFKGGYLEESQGRKPWSSSTLAAETGRRVLQETDDTFKRHLESQNKIAIKKFLNIIIGEYGQNIL